MLLTTCPNCGAKFKVSPEQLNVRQGRVMCGRCRHVFNAFEALKRIQDAEAGEPIDYALVDSRRTSDAAEAADVGEPSENLTTTTAAELTPPAPSQEERPVVAAADEAFDSYEDALKKLAQFEELQPLTVDTDTSLHDSMEEPAHDSTHDPAYEQTQDAAVAAESRPQDLTMADTEHTENDAERMSADPVANVVTEANVATDTPSVELERYAAALNNPLISGAVRQNAAPSRAWAWLAALAAVTLALQATYYFRSEIVQQYPQLRPQLVAACEAVGCNVPWGRDPTAIKIESSDLIEPPGKPGRILLTATLVNRAASKQDFPALEVKLTDANNAVLTSRVLMPAEYLGRTPSGDEGLSPNVELYINLNLEIAGKSPASGYGLQAFYR